MWVMAYAVTGAQVMSMTGPLVGAGVAGTSFGIVLPACVRAVPEERRGWALSLGTAAGSLWQFLVVPLMQEHIELDSLDGQVHLTSRDRERISKDFRARLDD